MAQTNWIPGLLSAWREEPGEELLVVKVVTFGGSQGFHQDQNSDRANQPVPVVLGCPSMYPDGDLTASPNSLWQEAENNSCYVEWRPGHLL